MKHFEIKKLAEIVAAKVQGDVAGSFSGVSIDSRAIKPGECFFAIKGQNHDGHDFVADVLAKGAACAVVDENFKGEAKGTILRVEDTIQALGDFARAYRKSLKCKIVAITGSAGKTTTREITHHVLSRHFKCHQAKKSFNNNIGLPLTLLELDPDHEVAIVELGTNSPGEILYLTKIAQPNIAIVTNAYPAHVEFFGSVDGIIKEKSTIADGLGENGVLIINADIPALVEHCRNHKLSFLTFGTTTNADVHATDIKFDGFASSCTIDGVTVKLPLAGKGNVENAVAAYAICKQFGITAKDFTNDVTSLVSVSMRLEPIALGSVLVISDCYNANPASMKNALDLLVRVSGDQPGRKVFICGPMMELGEHSEYLHRELGEQIALAGVDVVLAIGRFSQIVFDAATANTTAAIETHYFENINSLCDNLSNFIKPDDIILVKGSRSARLELAVERLRQLYAE
ncbi:MAG: UDP-N-acetylmuramoyl-tripeptide--D-alanyl-D-alanine ligase [Sedimentisphaerales bacterium]|nr:UDP-N-acetylmuramoyl-tripeptide--D-alanyl-D-alanine ligase [Sedimentisphaerales bacterium]